MLNSDFDEIGMFHGRNPMDRDAVFTKCRQENRFGDFPEKVRAALRKYRVFSPYLKTAAETESRILSGWS
jgi:hypothetical protein